MINPKIAQEFLAQKRIAVVGASDDPKSFGNTIFRAMRAHGYDAVPVNPTATTVDGIACFASVGEVPGHVDGAIVMVSSDRAPDIVDDCARKGVPRVWLFKGLGGAGAMCEEAVDRCAHHGIEVVPGACPLISSSRWAVRTSSTAPSVA